MKYLFTITVLFIFACIATKPLYAQEACPPTREGAYRNSEYGYALTIPNGIKSEWNSPCTLDDENQCICIGNHGLTVTLEDGAFISFFASYSVLENPSLADVLHHALKNIGPFRPKGIEHVKLRMKVLENAILAGRLAYHFIAEYEEDDVEFTEEHIVSVVNEPDIDYSIMLRAPSSRFSALRPVLKQIVDSWQWIPKYWENDWNKN